MRSCQAQLGSTAGGQIYVWNHRVTEWCIKCLSGTLQYRTAAWWKERLCVCMHLWFLQGWEESIRQASPLSTSHALVNFTDLPMFPHWVSHIMSKHRQEASYSSLTCLVKHTNTAYNWSITKWQRRTEILSQTATREHEHKKCGHINKCFHLYTHPLTQCSSGYETAWEQLVH